MTQTLNAKGLLIGTPPELFLVFSSSGGPFVPLMQGAYYSDQCAPGKGMDEHLSDSTWATP